MTPMRRILAVALMAAVAAVPATAEAKGKARPSAQADARKLARSITRARTSDARLRALLSTMRALRIGVYSSRGRPIVPGGERGPQSLYLYSFELRALAASLARGERFPMSDLRAQLAPMGIALDEAALARALTQAAQRAAAKPRHRASLGPLLLRELGLRSAADAKLDALQRFLVIADLAAAAHARRPRGVRASASAAPKKGLFQEQKGRACKFTGADKAAGDDWRFGRWIADKLIGVSPAGTVVEKLLTPLSNLWHATFLGLLMDVQPVKTGQVHDTAYGPVAHAGHTERNAPGQNLVFRIGAQLLADIPEDDVRCGKLFNLQFPNDGKRGPVKGVPVNWDPSLASGDFKRLLAHGTVVKKDIETDERGIAELIIKPHDEVMPGTGAVVTDVGVVQVGARIVGPFGNDFAEGWELLAPRLSTMAWSVQFHEQYAFDLTVTGRQSSTWMSRMSGPWAHDCDTNWDGSGSQTIDFTTTSPTRVVFFVLPGVNTNELRMGAFDNPYTPYPAVPLAATFDRQGTMNSTGNPECNAGGGGGGGQSPPPPDCGTRTITLQGRVQYRPTDARPVTFGSARPDQEPYSNCPYSGGFERELLETAAAGLDDARVRDLTTPRYVLRGNDTSAREVSQPQGEKSYEARSSTSIEWEMTMARVGTGG